MADSVSIQSGTAVASLLVPALIQQGSVPSLTGTTVPGLLLQSALSSNEAAAPGTFTTLLSGLLEGKIDAGIQTSGAAEVSQSPVPLSENPKEAAAKVAALVPTGLAGPTVAVSPGTASVGNLRTHIKGGKASGRDTELAAQALAGQDPPGIQPTPVAIGSQQQLAAACPDPTVPTAQATSDASIATAFHATDGLGQFQNEIALHRPALADTREGSLTPLDHPVMNAPVTGSPARQGEPDKFTIRSDVLSEAVALSMHTDIPRTSASGTGSTFAASAQSQPVFSANHFAPADQIAPALIGILRTTEGAPSVTVHLQPVELGQVQIRVDQTAGGAAHIDITAERPETLQMLQRDEPRLQQLLDQAGVQSSGRTVSFQMAPPEQIAAAASRPDSMASDPGGFSQGQSGGAWRQSDDSQRNFDRNPGSGEDQARPRWFRAGLDITA